MFRKAVSTCIVLSCLATAAFADHHESADLAACKRFYSEISKGNLAIVDELIDDQFVDHEEFEGLEANKSGTRDFFKLMLDAFTDFKMQPEFFLVDGDRIAVYMTISGRQTGDFIGMPATGNAFEIKGVDILRMKNGKAIEHWGVTDTMSMMQQLDAMDEAGDDRD